MTERDRQESADHGMGDQPSTRHIRNELVVESVSTSTIIQAGTIAGGIHHHSAPRTPAAWPHQVGVIPPRALSFQHRTEVDQLRAAVDSGGTAVLSQVLTGTGGVGKTQLAADYARTIWDGGGVDLLVWISASSRSAITTGYAQAGVEILASDPSDPEQSARAFLAWLEPKAGQKTCRWLVVLDDVADPADIRGWWPPTSPRGRVLVTTRRRESALTGAGRRLVTVGLFTPQDAAAYFTAVLAAHDRHEPTDQINSLAADLGYLPLALAQATAYIIDTNVTCADYRRLLADRLRTLADLLPEPSALPDDQAVTVAATWSLSIEQADRLRPAGLARPMLQLAAMLDPNGIPADVLTSRPALTHLTLHRTPDTQQPIPATTEDAAGALQALHRLSLVTYAPGQLVQVHRLVQRSVREQVPPDLLARTVRAAADALLQVWPQTDRDFATGQRFRANTETLRSHDEHLLWSDHDVHEVLLRLGQSLGRAGYYRASADHYRQLAATSAEKYGAGYRRTLACRGNSLGFLKFTTSPAEAVAAYTELAADYVRLVGQDDYLTFRARGDLADARAMGGDLAGALADYEELLIDHRRVRGPHHRDTLAVRSWIASLYSRTGDAPRATALYKELLDDCRTYLAPRDNMTLDIHMKLADLQGDAGDPAKARDHFGELLDEHLAAFGRDDHRTLVVRHELARWRAAAGDPAGAAAELADMIDDAVRILGAHHIDVANARFSLGLLRNQAGDATAAPVGIAESARLLEQTFGPDHPLVIGARGLVRVWQHGLVESDPVAAAEALKEVIAALRSVQGSDHTEVLELRRFLLGIEGVIGDPGQTAEAFAALLADCRRVLGPEHPLTLATRTELADWRGEAGDHAKAVADLRELQGDMDRVLGPHHPETLRTRTLLAQKLHAAGDTAAALTTYEDLITVHGHVLGLDHPDTIELRSALADCRADDAEADTMIPVYQQLIADYARVLGPDHPRTLDMRARLLNCRAEAGDPAGAAEECRELLRDYQRTVPPDHVETLAVRATYAKLLADSEDFAGSATAYEDLLPVALRIVGPDHLLSLMGRGCLAEARTRRDRTPADGLVAFAALFDDCLRVLGPGHYVTEATRAFRDALRHSGSALPSTTYDKLLDQYGKAERSGRAMPTAG
nr:NB-ARC domain-containing protein [Kibdelosporangium sp. MJ126-NF4]CEL13212.1 Putative ATP/GTP binding protein (partial match) [Kibdelosporangium sp. MJ126-NF4]CTQ98902.1 Putative ATP/GTP binding protein (partial match) [Kibdelosporangium sp. MJ126-NF4]